MTLSRVSTAASLKVLGNILARVERAAEKISSELEGKQSRAYATLVDLYNVESFREQLMGFMTLNYDDFLESAIEGDLGGNVDFGIGSTRFDSDIAGQGA